MESTEVTAPTSAQLLYAEREATLARLEPLPQESHRSAIYDAKVEDFRGKLDGGGVKQVMTEPKTPFELIAPQFIEGIAAVLLYGKKKYAANNWVRGMSFATVFGGVMRHMWAWFRGEELDAETGLPHICHAACGLMFLHWYCHGPQSERYRNTITDDGPLDDRIFHP